MSLSFKQNQGFTLIELIVSVSIFVFMTAFLVARYGNFNQSIIVTNTAYDMALAIRSAQSYGLNVKQSLDTRADSAFHHAFGAHFGLTPVFYTFSDVNDDGCMNTCATDTVTSNEVVSTSTIRHSISISNISAKCSGYGDISAGQSVDITFKRPDPDAIINVFYEGGEVLCNSVEMKMEAGDGSTRSVIVQSTGQIAIQ